MPNPLLYSRLFLVCVVVFFCRYAVADSPAQAPAETVEMVKAYCLDCHDGEEAEAGLDLAALAPNLGNDSAFDQWVHIYDRVQRGEMPPDYAGDIPNHDLQPFLKATRDWLEEYQLRQWREQGRVRGRRVTNLQLERTLHDLLGIDIPLASRMPEESRSAGFTTVATGQSMSHYQLKEHITIVDAALDEAFERAIGGDASFKKSLSAGDLSRSNPRKRTREPELIDGLAVTWSSRLIYYGRLPATTARQSGWYRFTIRAKALKRPANHGVWCSVRSGKCISSAPLLNWIGAFEATDEVEEWTFEAWLPKGHMLEVRPGDDTLKMARFRGGQVGSGEGGPQDVPGVAIESLDMERIYRGPGADRIKSALLGDLRVESSGDDWRMAHVDTRSPKRQLKQLLMWFAGRAFRRPVERAEVANFVRFARQALEDGLPFVEALRLGYRAILCSPRFLYLLEQPGELDSHAIASRLSYFLWNSMPDEELLRLAAEDRLRQPDVLRRQVQRMLSDPRGQKFVGDFAAEWLDLSQIDFTTPDRRLYPGFDAIVQYSMVSETERFLQDMVENDRSVALLIDSEHTFLNERLARYYGIDRVAGDKLRKTKLRSDDRRGGLLTHGAILKVTANGTTTSPVIRGVWIAERFLGEHVPPPPAGIAAIEPDIRGATTIRELLEKHKSDASCASCHRIIDPPGFALENYDAAGRWRDAYQKIEKRRVVDGQKVDATYQLSDGEEFQNLEEFKQLIVKRADRIAANVAGKLLTYGTGAPVMFADRATIEEIVDRISDGDYGFRSIIEEVVCSQPFLAK